MVRRILAVCVAGSLVLAGAAWATTNGTYSGTSVLKGSFAGTAHGISGDCPIPKNTFKATR
jgi:hypothetical protein